METLLIKLNQDRQSAEWAIINPADHSISDMQQSSLTSIAALTPQRQVVCTLPNTELYLDQVVIPYSRNRRNWRQAVPYALEEELAEDLDELHFAYGKEQVLNEADDDAKNSAKHITIPVAVVGKQRLQQWLDILNNAGINATALIPEALALPLQEQEWSILIDNATAIIRTQEFAGYACDSANLSTLLNAGLIENTEVQPKQLRVWSAEQTDNNPDLAAELQNEMPIVTADSERLAVGAFARGYQKDHGINLLQGVFKQQDSISQALKYWRLPALCFAGLLALVIGNKVFEYSQLKTTTEQLEQALIDTYRDAFPTARNVIRPRLQMEQKLQELNSASNSSTVFLNWIAVAADEIEDIPNLQVLTVNFSNQRLDIELSVTDLQTLDRLKNALTNDEIRTELQSASATDDQVIGRLRMQRAR